MFSEGIFRERETLRKHIPEVGGQICIPKSVPFWATGRSGGTWRGGGAFLLKTFGSKVDFLMLHSIFPSTSEKSLALFVSGH